MKKYTLIFSILFIIKFSYSQTIMTICDDGTLKVYTDYELKIHADRCKDGKKLLIDDSTKRIIVETNMKDCRKNGVYKRFYKNEKLKELGNYFKGKKDGNFYFWNSSGLLLKKEIWKKNIRLKIIKY